jgi:hypothetical protein
MLKRFEPQEIYLAMTLNSVVSNHVRSMVYELKPHTLKDL